MRISDILNEAITEQVTVFYGGRFQPMHKGHYALYERLVQRFGSNNVFIATTIANNVDLVKNPFTFEEKASIASRMFGIDKNQIINTSPYRPEIEKTGRKPSETAMVLAFSEKDAGRLKESDVLKKFPEDGKNLQTIDENRVYFLSMPVNEGGMSATDFRAVMATGKDSTGKEKDREKTFVEFFGKMDKQIFNFINGRLNK